ncbi:hypothetical protein ACFQ0M_22900 [Kitasatospora aburaviensis]
MPRAISSSVSGTSGSPWNSAARPSRPSFCASARAWASSGACATCVIASNWADQSPRCSTNTPLRPSHTATNRSSESPDASFAAWTTRARDSPMSPTASIIAALSSASLEPKW